MKRRTVSIKEESASWLVTTAVAAVRLPTAAEALNFVQEQDLSCASRGVSVITTVEWETVTSIGKRIVNALR